MPLFFLFFEGGREMDTREKEKILEWVRMHEMDKDFVYAFVYTDGLIEFIKSL